jgi:hypothetical protein
LQRAPDSAGKPIEQLDISGVELKSGSFPEGVPSLVEGW